MARMILLGVGTALPDADRECTFLVFDAPGGPILIDVAGEAYGRLLRAGLDPLALRAIVLTHSHADHIYGFPILLTHLFMAGRRTPIQVFGNADALHTARQLVAASRIDEYALPAEYVEIDPGADLPIDDAVFRVRTAQTVHSRPALALRFEERSSGRAAVCSADTEPCQAVLDLARGAGILFHEATIAEPAPSHTTPRQAGEIAVAAGVERLVLVHFSPRWTMPVERALAELRSAGFDGPASVGVEGDSFTVW